jgi:hypothetical protein
MSSAELALTGGLSLGVNVKAKFGAGDDLQIYHDGNDSIVKDAGEGGLSLRGTSYVKITSGSGATEYLATNTTTGAIALKHSGSTKIYTTSTGVDVTGSVTCDGASIAGQTSINSDTGTTNDAVNVLNLTHTSTSTTANGFGVGLGFFTENSTYSTTNEIGRIEVIETNEPVLDDDMVFYNKTNNTLTEKLRLNSTGVDVTGSVTADGLVNNGDVVFSKSSTGVPTLKMSGFAGANNPYGVINFYNEDGSQQGPNNAVQIKALAKNVDGSGGQLAFHTSTGTAAVGADALERMRIDSSGNVGIGTTAPDQTMHIHKGSAGTVVSDGNAVLTVENSSHSVLQMLAPKSQYNIIVFGNPTDGALSGRIQYDNNNKVMQLWTNSTERLRITSAGSVGIGTSSPTALLHLNSTTANPTGIGIQNSQRYYAIESEGYGLRVKDVTAGGLERMRIDSSGKLIVNGGMIQLNGNELGGISVFVADDTVATIDTPRYGGFMHITMSGESSYPSAVYSGKFFYDTGGSTAMTKISTLTGSYLDASTATLSGTTGTNGRITVSAASNKTIQIENRQGVNRYFQVTFS